MIVACSLAYVAITGAVAAYGVALAVYSRVRHRGGWITSQVDGELLVIACFLWPITLPLWEIKMRESMRNAGLL